MFFIVCLIIAAFIVTFATGYIFGRMHGKIVTTSGGVDYYQELWKSGALQTAPEPQINPNTLN